MRTPMFYTVTLMWVMLATTILASYIITEPTLQRRSEAIRLEIGVSKVNVGELYSGALYNEIYKAIERACPPFDAKKCVQTQAKFTVWTSGGLDKYQTDLYIQVNWADWKDSKQIYNILRGAIASTVERGAIDLATNKNCYYIGPDWFCNVMNSVGIFLPNDMGQMGVSLYSRPTGGDFDCGRARETITAGLDSLKKEIEEVAHIGNTYYDVVCCWGENEKCKDNPKVRGKE